MIRHFFLQSRDGFLRAVEKLGGSKGDLPLGGLSWLGGFFVLGNSDFLGFNQSL